MESRHAGQDQAWRGHAGKILRAGHSVWDRSAGASVLLGRLEDCIKADVVVVGAGISGAFIAHALTQHFERVVVGRLRAARGFTRRSTSRTPSQAGTA